MEAKDGQWGEVMSDGWVTGMIGVVARREADLAVNEITITGTFPHLDHNEISTGIPSHLVVDENSRDLRD